MFQLPIGGWALARLLPVYVGEGSKDYARSLRRRFAFVGLVVVVGLVAFLWTGTESVAVCAGVFVLSLAGLWFYSEHGHRAGPNTSPPSDPLEDTLS